MPDPASLVALGLLGLFLAAFLAGSVLPFPSEVVLLALLAAGASPGLSVAVATLGNVLGAVTVYLLGLGLLAGGRRLRGLEPPDPEQRSRALAWIQRWGAGALLLSWVPVVGDVIVLGAGLARVRALPFLVLVTLGKGGRYLLVAAAAAAV